jgi:transposase
MEVYPTAAVERAMKVQEVMLKAMSGRLKWIEAAEILKMSPRTMRRWRFRLERDGTDALLDRRCRLPSPRRAPVAEVQRILHLYRERYAQFNVRHFHEIAQREHGVTLSYTFVRGLLQGARLVAKRRPRGKHRLRRPRRECFGELLHLDGSPHRWLALAPELRCTLITVVDDATSQALYGQLWPEETTGAVMTALAAVIRTHGLPQALYTDRACWAACVRRAAGRPRPDRPTQVQRALTELGIEHIHAYSPQARGRSERVNRTMQGRLVNELRLAGIRTLPTANRYLIEHYLPIHNQRFARPPADPTNVFVPLGPVDLDRILCQQAFRQVGRDNTVTLLRTVLQIPKQPGRRSCQGMRVLVRRHLDGRFSTWSGPRLLARFDRAGRLAPTTPTAPDSPGANGSVQKRSDHLPNGTGQFTC